MVGAGVGAGWAGVVVVVVVGGGLVVACVGVKREVGCAEWAGRGVGGGGAMRQRWSGDGGLAMGWQWR